MKLNHAPTASYSAKSDFNQMKFNEGDVFQADDETIARCAKELAQIRIDDANRQHEDGLILAEAA